MSDDLFSIEPPPAQNAPQELSVSEISQQLKRMVEGNFSYVRVRGELSRVTIAKSGHLYTDLKDDKSVLNAVCWKGTVSRLSIRPEEGMEVVCTGRLTTYPGRSNYQIVIEHMELAGQGALLKMLEERRKKLAAEGLFDANRKQPIPFIPDTIGVITSPTGAVIRDIMHRLNERFPRRVLLYPVMVQGQGAAETITEAVKRFNLIPEGSPDRPDVLIVARGGGSIEDLMPFNDEALVRAVAASTIPVISAVGHETDTTLIDYAADLRAPTPTAAAEKAVPVKSELITLTFEHQNRLQISIQRALQHHTTHLQGVVRGLGDPQRMVDTHIQRIDHIASRLDHGLSNWLNKKTLRLREASSRLSPHPIRQRIKTAANVIGTHTERLRNAERKQMSDKQSRLAHLTSLLESFSFERVLERGYAVVLDQKKKPITSSKELRTADEINIRLKDGITPAKISK